MSGEKISQIEESMREMAVELGTLPSVNETPKTTLEIIGRREGERYWNSLLCYFLDPEEPHGLDTDLLEEVLNGIPFEKNTTFDKLELENARVVSEPQMDEGQADMAVYIEGEWFILFELKVGSEEDENQTIKYAESDKVDSIPKGDFREGEFYVFVSKEGKSSEADEFVDISWQTVAEAIDTVLLNSEGRYTARGCSQLKDFRDSIKMNDTENERIQEEKMKLYAEYHDELEDIKSAFEKRIEDERNRWYKKFPAQFEPDGWSEVWNCYENEYGSIYCDRWWINEEGEQVGSLSELEFSINFKHYIRDDASFAEGKLKFQTRTYRKPNRDEYRNTVKELFNNEFYDELTKVLQNYGIRHVGGNNTHTEKEYQYDVSDGTDGYYKTLRKAFEEHLELAPIITEVHETAVERVTDGEITF